ncbi:MAG TPA: zf-HC2 domain-containing protein, partial [Bryobacteraceae bacterium]
MTECWAEGRLRAYLDGECPPEELERIGAHLAECEDCRTAYEELAARAARVGEWMEALAEP